jgi:hypothetical protein
MTNHKITSRDEYELRLKAHDWLYDFCDAVGTGRWQSGHDDRENLSNAQREFDADYTLWNTHAPSIYKVELDND